MKHLMDAATNEYAFTKQFFADNSREIFHQIYTKTLSLILENLENFLYNCHDAVCLLLMIRLTESNRKTMKQRNANVLDNFFDRINMLLWPRLKTIFDNNLKSLKTATPKKVRRYELSIGELLLASTSTAPTKVRDSVSLPKRRLKNFIRHCCDFH
jgi:hypothetical protein